MLRHPRLLFLAAVLAALSLAVAGCGGGSDSSSGSDEAVEETTTVETTTEEEPPEEEATETEADEGEDETETEATETEPEDSDSSSTDTGSIPPPGQASVEVDGKTFIFLASDTISDRLLSCDISEEVVTINFQTDGHDILIQARVLDGEWLGNTTVAPMEVEGSYGASVGDGEMAIDGQSAVFTGAFTFSPQENPADFQDVGEGRIAVTCP